uniref:Sushi domain-containing protein n=1 Tax=Chrysemys picta bellii TaxID=8478 RepID=A0A8C3F8N6_CHRPI
MEIPYCHRWYQDRPPEVPLLTRSGCAGTHLSFPLLMILPLFCSQPPNISHGQYNDWGKRDFVGGSSVTYRCDRGFSLVGKQKHLKLCWCCSETRCPKPVVENGKQISPVKTEYTYANRVVFQCDPDYILRGSEGIVCWSDGMWHPPVPFCDKCDKEFLHCDVPVTELRTLLELKKLYLEIQKLKQEIKKL